MAPLPVNLAKQMGEGECRAIGQQVDDEATAGHCPAPAAFRVVMLSDCRNLVRFLFTTLQPEMMNMRNEIDLLAVWAICTYINMRTCCD